MPIQTPIANILNNPAQFSAVSGTTAVLGTSSIDGTDSNSLFLTPANGATNFTRGGTIQLDGNEVSNGGGLYFNSGNVSTGNISFYAPHSSSKISFGVGAGSDEWKIINGGLLQTDTNAGDIVLSKSGVTIRVDSGTAASAARGSATLNGTTAVTVNTTAATTGMSVIIMRTSAGAAGNAYFENVVNGTSFDLKSSNAADTGTVHWWIIKEG